MASPAASLLPPDASARVAAAAVWTDDLVKSFDDHVAVDHVSFDVPPGTIVGIIGPSGSGKTTLIRLLTGVLTPTSGAVEVLGRVPSAFTRADRRRFGYLPQIAVLFPNLTLWGNLAFVASLYDVPLRGRRQRLHDLLDFVDLNDRRHTRFAQASGGMQRRLSLAATLVHGPELLFLDEPTAGIDPILRERFWNRFRALRDEGRTLVVSTQYVGEAALCDRVVVLSDGRLLADASPEDLARQAYGGERVLLRLDEDEVTNEVVADLRRVPGVRHIDHHPDGLLLAVDDGSEQAAALTGALAPHGITIAVEQPPIDYDEVFVRLVGRDRAARA